MVLRAGGAFRLVHVNALQQDGEKVHYFYMKSFAAGPERFGPGESRHFQTPEALLRRLGFYLLQTLIKVFLLVLHLQEVVIIDAHLAAESVNLILNFF